MSRRAFTLVEVTIVILLVGILAAVTAPRFSAALRVTRLKAAALQLATHIDYIRAVALNEGRNTSLICDNASHTYASGNVEFPERIGELILVSIPTEFDSGFTLQADFDSQTTLTFDYEGVPHVGGLPLVNGQVVLTSGSDSMVITVVSGSGRTRVQSVGQMGAATL